MQVCCEAAEVCTRAFGIRAPWTLEDLARADTVIVPGTDDPTLPVPDAIATALRAAYANGARVASICSGTFILAASGLLDGRRATTHWLAAELLAKRYPTVRVDPDVLFVDEGRIVTSAGASAGLDMCLHLLRRDHGHAVAAHAARLAVAPLDREGGQAQFIRHEAPGSNAKPGAVARLDARECPSTVVGERTGAPSRGQSTHVCPALPRADRHDAATVADHRAGSARAGNAGDNAAVPRRDRRRAGFDGAAALCDRFRRAVGVSPNAYRRSFGLPTGHGSGERLAGLRGFPSSM